MKEFNKSDIMLTNKKKLILKYHISLHIVTTFTMWILLAYKVVLVAFCICLTLPLFIYLRKRFNIRKDKREEEQTEQIKNIQGLIHEIIEIEYIYGYDHTKFHAKLLELLTVESLLKRGIVSPDKMSRTIIFNREIEDIDRKDAEFLALLAAGFSSRGIKVVYELKDLNSVYTKTRRLKERLSERQQKLREIQNGCGRRGL